MITSEVAARIKAIVKERGYKVGDFLRDCGMGVNALSQMAKAQDISASTLVVFAEHLSCSVDYLLGKTENPQGDTLDISEIEFALSGEIRDLSEAEKQDVLDYVRFKRSQKAGAKNDN